LLALDLAGCQASGGHAPSIDVFGSYFPAWMICLFAGIALTLIFRQLLVLLKLHGHVHPAPIVYPSLIAIFTLLAWLAFYQN
jgi:hypothetical protein